MDDFTHQRFQYFARALCGSLLAILLTACTAGSREPAEQVSTASSALEGPQILAIALPRDVQLQNIALAGSVAVIVDDRGQVVPPQTGLVSLASSGSGQTNIGVEALVPGLSSVGPVFLRDRAHVTGSLTTGGVVTRQTSTIIDGALTEHAVLTPPQSFGFTVTLPASGPVVDLQPGASQALPPGSYAAVSVKSGAVLSLSAGNYYFDSLTVEPTAKLSLGTMTEPTFIYLRTTLLYKGTITGTNVAPNLFVGDFGTAAIFLEGPFLGTIVAPNADVVLGITPNGHSGSFFGKTVQLRSTLLKQVPFGHWDIPLATTFGDCRSRSCSDVARACDDIIRSGCGNVFWKALTTVAPTPGSTTYQSAVAGCTTSTFQLMTEEIENDDGEEGPADAGTGAAEKARNHRIALEALETAKCTRRARTCTQRLECLRGTFVPPQLPFDGGAPLGPPSDGGTDAAAPEPPWAPGPTSPTLTSGFPWQDAGVEAGVFLVNGADSPSCAICAMERCPTFAYRCFAAEGDSVECAGGDCCQSLRRCVVDCGGYEPEATEADYAACMAQCSRTRPTAAQELADLQNCAAATCKGCETFDKLEDAP